MNYANMIEEKNLKKTFIIATLVSTLINTFAQGHNFYERFKQKKVDQKQSDAIKKLQDEIKDRDKKDEEKRKKRRDDDDDDDDNNDRDRDRDDRRDRSRGPRNRKDQFVTRDELEESLGDAGWMIKHEYNRNYDRVGRRFAVGDTITQNELQAQIIMLQQTVINILQDALYNPDGVSAPDMSRLIKASNNAREGSIQALAGQYQRMLQVAPLPAAQLPPSPPSSAISVRSLPPSETPKDPLYCRYAMSLQLDPQQDVSEAFKIGGDMSCPTCLTRIPIEPQRAWKISVEENGLERIFHVGNRFVIKAHRSNGEYACTLCSRNRDVDTICESAKGLVRHVWRIHDPAEYERELDIKEVIAPRPVEQVKVKEIKQIEARPQPRDRDIIEILDNGRGKREAVEVREHAGRRETKDKVEVMSNGGWREVREEKGPGWRDVMEIRDNGRKSRAGSVAGSRRGD